MLYPDTEIIELMQNGIIINWEVAEILWQHLFDHELQVPVPREASTNFQKKTQVNNVQKHPHCAEGPL